MKYRISFFSLMLCIAMVIPVSAEYYQYRDKDGNLHFTDNRAEIPEAALDRVKSFDSEETEETEETEKASSYSSGQNQPSNRKSSIPDPNTWDGKVRINAEALDREKEKLDQVFRRLQEEKAELQNPNSKQRTPEERSAYKDRLHDLNDRIDRYHQKQKQFEKKVDQFNEKLKKEPSTESSGLENET